MIEFLRSWVQNIIYIIIFVVFLEILLPNNSMRKYVKVVAGLLVMLAIISPITMLFNTGFDMENIISKYYMDINEVDIKNQQEILQGQQTKLAIQIYKEKIAQQMEKQLEEMLAGRKMDVQVEVFDIPEDDNYGKIKEVTLYVVEEVQQSNGKNEPVKPIEKITIGDGVEGEKEEYNTEKNLISSGEEKEVKEFLLDFYNVPIENITINKQKNTKREGER